MLTFQSSEVTSLLLGTSCPPSRMQCLRTSCVELLVLFSLRFQIRAVESPDLSSAHVWTCLHLYARALLLKQIGGTHPDASRSLTGFQAQMKTSDSWPLRTMALFWGISTSPSTSIRSAWLSEGGNESNVRLTSGPGLYLSSATHSLRRALRSPLRWQCSLRSWCSQWCCLLLLMLVPRPPPAAGPFCPDKPAASSERHPASLRRWGTTTRWAARQTACRPAEKRSLWDEERPEACRRAALLGHPFLTSLMLTSASTYCRPFWMMLMRAAGGTRAPLMLDWLMWLSMPKVKAEWENPAGEQRHAVKQSVQVHRPAYHSPQKK